MLSLVGKGGIQDKKWSVISVHTLLNMFFILQHNCPVGNVDLQGRTALHDAGRIKWINFKSISFVPCLRHVKGFLLNSLYPCSWGTCDLSNRWDEIIDSASSLFLFFIAVMAGCSSSVKLLCDGGAAVNASDFVRIDLSISNNVLMFSPTVCCLSDLGWEFWHFFSGLKMINMKSVVCISCMWMCRLRSLCVLYAGRQDTSGLGNSDVSSTHLPAAAGAGKWYHNPGQTK